MKKKLIIRMLSMILCLALFATGCGSKQEENSNNITITPATEKTDENNGSVKNDEKRRGDTLKTLLDNGEYADKPKWPIVVCVLVFIWLAGRQNA